MQYWHHILFYLNWKKIMLRWKGLTPSAAPWDGTHVHVITQECFFFPSKRITAIPKEGAVQVGIHISTISMQPLAIPQEGAVQVGIHISTISMQPQATP